MSTRQPVDRISPLFPPGGGVPRPCDRVRRESSAAHPRRVRRVLQPCQDALVSRPELSAATRSGTAGDRRGRRHPTRGRAASPVHPRRLTCQRNPLVHTLGRGDGLALAAQFHQHTLETTSTPHDAPVCGPYSNAETPSSIVRLPWDEVFGRDRSVAEVKAILRAYIGRVEYDPETNRARVGFLRMPARALVSELAPKSARISMVAGVGFEPTTSGL